MDLICACVCVYARARASLRHWCRVRKASEALAPRLRAAKIRVGRLTCRGARALTYAVRHLFAPSS